MRAPMPRLVKDGKSGIWFFRWSLPKSHQQNLNQKTLYITLRTRDARLAQSHAALLNLRVEAMKKIPNLNEDAIRKLLEIDMERGIFRADTPEEQERGLQILENLGRIRASTPQQNNAPALRRAPAMTPTSPLFRAVADELIREISLTLKKASVDKYRSTYDAFREHTGNRFVEDIIRFVPVHSFLIKLGFLDYVEEVRKLGHEGLFWYPLKAAWRSAARSIRRRTKEA